MLVVCLGLVTIESQRTVDENFAPELEHINSIYAFANSEPNVGVLLIETETKQIMDVR